uniref:Oligomycin sensitivity conferral protein n=1 Tax=Hirondellea gigas TaxID=1518452 RepID=A0A6A7FMF1_9CRUS
MAATSPFLILARKLSTSSASQQLVKAPIQIFTLEGRYATALYSAATKQKVLPQVEKDLKEFRILLKSDKPLRDILMSPLTPKDLKKEAINFVISKKKNSPLTGNLLCALAENGRLAKVNGVVDAFETIMAAERGEVVCEVTTAKALDAAGLKEIEGALRAFLKKGETLNLTTKIDPSIIGGMLVSIADKYVDMSIASKISKYTKVIQEAV